MDLSMMDFVKMLPFFMQTDAADIGLAGAVDTIIEEVYSKIILFTTWDKIDVLSSDELDELAEELHISWYDKTSAIDIRRSIIKEYGNILTKSIIDKSILSILLYYM